MNVVGLSAFYHESACCLLVDGRLVAAAAEERFSRIKHDPRLPVHAFRACLDAGNLDLTDVDAVAYYEEPIPKLARQIWAGAPDGDADRPWLDPHQAERSIREGLGWDGPVLSFPHHLSHAASAYFYSGFPDAAVLTVDGVGEWATTTYGRADGADLELFGEVRFPHSLGLLYSTLTAYLGFRVNGGEAKVMGLAPYGEPRFADRLRHVVDLRADGDYRLDLRYFGFLGGRRMWSRALEDLLEHPPRKPESEISDVHRDLARSLQEVTEEILLDRVRWLATQTDSEHLCMAGGVALNCVSNGRILRDGPFRRLFVQPAAGDQGACLGAAALAHRRLTEETLPREELPHAHWGRGWSADEIEPLLRATGLRYRDYRRREPELMSEAARLLASGAVVGWFSGREELGPRALGARSILADPRNPDVRDRLNRKIKRREDFRPFAPSVLAEHATEHFDLTPEAVDTARFMLSTCRVTSPRKLPAVTHVDGSARPQVVERERIPRFAALLDAFHRRTGCPVLLNTSFNVRGEPIVSSPVDALKCMVDAELDALVLEGFLLERSEIPARVPELLATLDPAPPSPFAQRTGPGRTRLLDPNLYTFV